jgi:hypothetical protein
MGKKRGPCLVCTCSSYKFPHRLGGGRCSGEDWVQQQRLFGDSRVCQTCSENEGHSCAPAEGRERLIHCQVYIDALHEQGI